MNSSMPGVMSMVESNPRKDVAGLSPYLASFMHQLPAVNGNSPDTEMVISILLQSDIPSEYIDSTAPLIPQSSSAFPASNCAIDYDSSLRKGTHILNGSNMNSYKAAQGCRYFMNSSILSIPRVIHQNNVGDPLSKSLKDDNTLKNSIPPSLTSFIHQLPIVNGPSPDVDRVISILLQSDIPYGFINNKAQSALRRPNSSNRNVSVAISDSQSTMPSKTSQRIKRKQNENEELTPEKPMMDIFRRRQIRKLQAMATSQSSSTSSVRS